MDKFPLRIGGELLEIDFEELMRTDPNDEFTEQARKIVPPKKKMSDFQMRMSGDPRSPMFGMLPKERLAVSENLATLGSSMAAEAPAGLNALRSLVRTGDVNEAVRAAEATQNAMTVAPRSQAGIAQQQGMAEALQSIGNFFAENVNEPLERAIDKGTMGNIVAGGLAAGALWGLMELFSPDVPNPSALRRRVLPDSQLGMVGWHGSPYKFDEFMTEAIGTGEGAQAFGYGLYFAENPGVAKSYQTALSNGVLPESLISNAFEELYSSDNPALASIEFMSEISDESDGIRNALAELAADEEFIADLNRYVDEEDLLGFDEADQLRTKIENRINDANTKHVGGHLYEVDIPDETVEKMLNWDAPLSEQPESVQKAMANVSGFRGAIADAADIRQDKYGDQKWYLVDSRGEWGTKGFDSKEAAMEAARSDTDALVQDLLQGQGNVPASQLYQQLANRLGGQQNASAVLENAGIPGIRFLDGSSRSKGEGTRNIVVFNPADIRSVKRDGVEVMNRNRRTGAGGAGPVAQRGAIGGGMLTSNPWPANAAAIGKLPKAEREAHDMLVAAMDDGMSYGEAVDYVMARDLENGTQLGRIAMERGAPAQYRPRSSGRFGGPASQRGAVGSGRVPANRMAEPEGAQAELLPKFSPRDFIEGKGSGKNSQVGAKKSFSAALENARAAMTEADAAQVSPMPAGYKGRVFMTEDGMAGFAINAETGTLEHLFRHPDAKASGVMGAALTKARAAGAKNLEAFDTYLVDGYIGRGAVETNRFTWSDEETGPQLAAALPQKPDYVQMDIGGVIPEREFSEALGDRGQSQPGRYDPARGVPDEVKDYFKGGRVARLKRLAEQGKKEGGDRWYWLGGLLDKFIEELGPELGAERFDLFMDLNAAMSPRSPVAQQIKRASVLYQRAVQGKDIKNMRNAPSDKWRYKDENGKTQIVDLGPYVAAKDQFPAGSGTMAHNIQMQQVRRLVDKGQVGSTVDQPKIATFAQNLKGNYAGVTIDAHNNKIITGRSDSPNANEYAAMEAYQQRIAQQMGITPAAFQAALWVGAKNITGVVDSTNMTAMMNQRIAKTADALDISEEEALVRFIRGDTALYSVMLGLFGVNALQNAMKAESGAQAAEGEA